MDEVPRAGLDQNVLEWLTKEGYPLEFETADVCRRHGFRVRQGIYTSAADDRPPREIDIVADQLLVASGIVVRVEFVIECKWSRDKPWVMFCSDDHGMTPAACAAQTIGTELGHALIWKEAGREGIQGLNLFSRGRAFGGRQAFSKSHDVLFDAVRAVTGNCHDLVTGYDRKGAAQPGRERGPAVVGFPVIIVDGELFEASYGPTGTQVEAVDRTRIQWRGSDRNPMPHVTVDVVRSDRLEQFIARRAADAEVLIEILADAAVEYVTLRDEKRIQDISVTTAARGILGGPPLFGRLVREANESGRASSALEAMKTEDQGVATPETQRAGSASDDDEGGAEAVGHE